MARSILGFLVAATLAVAGCGSGLAGGSPAPSTFQSVMNECNFRSLYYTSGEIATLIDFADIDRSNGYDYQSELAIAASGCVETWGFGTVEATDCSVCARAIISYVYGR